MHSKLCFHAVKDDCTSVVRLAYSEFCSDTVPRWQRLQILGGLAVGVYEIWMSLARPIPCHCHCEQVAVNRAEGWYCVFCWVYVCA